MEKPKKLNGRTNMLWSEIVSQQFNFDRDNVEAERIRQITKDDLLTFFRTHFKADAKDRKKLSCHVVSMADGGAGVSSAEGKSENNASEVIEDPVRFRSNLLLHPHVPPYVNIETLFKNGSQSEGAN